MKIAVVVNTFPSASQTFIATQVDELVRQGHEVEIFAHGMERGVHHAVVARVLEYCRVTYFRFPRQAYHLIEFIRWCLYNLPTLFEVANYSRLSAKHFPFFGMLLKVFYLTKASEQSDAVFSHFATAGAPFAFIPRTGSTRLLFFHGYDVNRFPLEVGLTAFAKIIASHDIFISNTEFTKRIAMKNGVPSNRIYSVPVGLNFSLFPPVEERPRRSRVELISIGRLVEKKGIEFTIRACGILLASGFSEFRYTIVGDGPLKDSLAHLAHSLNLHNHVEFKGTASQEAVRELLSVSDILLMPSVTASDGDKEGQGLVMQEAQLLEVPVVATDHNGFSEGVVDAETALLVPERSPESLASAIKTLCDSDETRRRFGRAGRQFVLKKYDIRFTTAAVLKHI